MGPPEGALSPQDTAGTWYRTCPVETTLRRARGSALGTIDPEPLGAARGGRADRRMRVRRGPLPPQVGAADRPLLPLSQLPAPNRERVRAQPDHRGGPRGARRRRAGPRRRAAGRRWRAADLSVPGLPGGRLQRLYTRERVLHPRRNARRATFARPRRPHLRAVEGRLGDDPCGNARVRRALRHRRGLAGSEPRPDPRLASRRYAREM